MIYLTAPAIQDDHTLEEGTVMPKISIIVPVYKVEHLLDRCVLSILGQTYSNFELLLVDDGSPDRCGEMCEEYAKKDSRVRVFHRENGGQGAARNMAIDWVIANSDSQWITFVDSDDWIHRDYLNVLLAAVKQCNAQVSMCEFHTTDKVMEESAVDTGNAIKLESEDAITQYYHLCTAPWGKLYAKELFTHLRFQETRAFEDAFITHIPVFEANCVAYTDAKLYYYFVNQESTTRKKWSPRNLAQFDAHEVRMAYCIKHGYQQAYKRELEAYVIVCFAQATELAQLVKKDKSFKKYLKDLRPKLLPTLRLAKQHGLIPFNKEYLWIYEIAYPVKPVWVLRNFLEKTFGLDYPK